MSFGKDGRMKEYFKIAIFAVVALAVGYITVFYLRGDLPLPFLPEISQDGSSQTIKPDLPPVGADNPHSEPVDPALTENVRVLTKEAFFALISETAGKLSSDPYEPSKHTFGQLGSLPALENVYSFDDETIFEEEEGEEITVLQNPHFYARMGFLFRKNEDGTESLFDADGQLIFETVPQDLTLLSARYKDGRPLFKRGKEYVCFDEEQRAFVPVSYDERKDSNGFAYDYPVYVGRGDTDDIVFVYTPNTVGCAKADAPDELLVSGYREVFSPSEGFVVFVGKNQRLSVRSVSKLAMPQFIAYSLYLPDSRGEESMGYFYFDHGLMRARQKIVADDEVISDEEIVLSADGTVFSIPVGCKIVSYSDGVFLLEKDGLYGYYSHEGQWITSLSYTYARPFFEGLAVCGKADGKKCMIDVNGETVIPYYFDEIGDCSDGLIVGYSYETSWCVLRKSEA